MKDLTNIERIKSVEQMHIVVFALSKNEYIFFTTQGYLFTHIPIWVKDYDNIVWRVDIDQLSIKSSDDDLFSVNGMEYYRKILDEDIVLNQTTVTTTTPNHIWVDDYHNWLNPDDFYYAFNKNNDMIFASGKRHDDLNSSVFDMYIKYINAIEQGFVPINKEWYSYIIEENLYGSSAFIKKYKKSKLLYPKRNNELELVDVVRWSQNEDGFHVIFYHDHNHMVEVVSPSDEPEPESLIDYTVGFVDIDMGETTFQPMDGKMEPYKLLYNMAFMFCYIEYLHNQIGNDNIVWLGYDEVNDIIEHFIDKDDCDNIELNNLEVLFMSRSLSIIHGR